MRNEHCGSYWIFPDKESVLTANDCARYAGLTALAPFFSWSEWTHSCYACTQAQVDNRYSAGVSGYFIYDSGSFVTVPDSPNPPPSPPPKPPPSPPPPLGSGLIFPRYFCGDISWPVATQIRDPSDCAAAIAKTSEWQSTAAYFSWSKVTQNCYACTGIQTADRVKRNDGFNIYRTGDYVANLPSAKVHFAGRGCGRLVAKTAPTAQSCAAATAAAGSLPYFAWSEINSFCFACAEASEESALAPGYDIYLSEEFPISFEEIKHWMKQVTPLSVWRDSELRATGFAGVHQRQRTVLLASRAMLLLAAVASALALREWHARRVPERGSGRAQLEGPDML
ncbi:hypothetical protein T492DRAFT_936388 [Pavlovales sp. CCMP2436]|nr:hypothetical protein T492DRAFT_936388 [Pavlovales sp. CCMP2436]